jgi:hypothetical protein
MPIGQKNDWIVPSINNFNSDGTDIVADLKNMTRSVVPISKEENQHPAPCLEYAISS